MCFLCGILYWANPLPHQFGPVKTLSKPSLHLLGLILSWAQTYCNFSPASLQNYHQQTASILKLTWPSRYSFYLSHKWQLEKGDYPGRELLKSISSSLHRCRLDLWLLQPQPLLGLIQASLLPLYMLQHLQVSTYKYSPQGNGFFRQNAVYLPWLWSDSIKPWLEWWSWLAERKKQWWQYLNSWLDP